MISLAKNSIQTRLMVFFIAIAVVLFLTVGLLFFRSTEYAINSSKENELLTLSKETEDKIERFLFERYGDIQVMAQSPLLRNDEIGTDTQLEYLNTVIKAYETYDCIFITDSTGRIKVMSGNLHGDLSYRSWISNVLKEKTYVSDFIKSDNSEPKAVYYAAPIIGENGKVKGAVVERMNFNAIRDIVSNVHPSKLGYAYLQSGTDNFPQGDAMENGNTNSMGIQKPNIYFSRDKNIDYVSAYFPVKKYNTQKDTWYLTVQEPFSEAFQVTYGLRNYTEMVILISVLAMCVLGMILSALITQPIKKLVFETHNIAYGDGLQNIDIKGSDEIGSLAQSFNRLLTNLKAMTEKVLEVSGEAAYLEEIREYAEKLFDSIPSALITMDSTGKITAFNNASSLISGIRQEEILGRNSEESMPEALQPIIKLLIDGFEKGTIYIKHIAQIINSTGENIPVVINTSIQKDDRGKTIGVVGVFRRVEEIKSIEESVIRARNLASLGAMSAGMAHEIRNPLTSIKGYAQYIKYELGDNHELIPDISVIISEVDRLNNIIDRFLSFARPKEPDLKKDNINRIIEAVFRLLEKEGIQDNITVINEFHAVPDMLLDFEQIEQVLLNIIINSIQAMPEGGALKVITRHVEEQGTVEVEVADTGIGIAAENYDKIFEPFFTTKNRGTGLGLAISSRIIENHGGLIEVKSVPGKGTSFILRFIVKK